MNQLRRKARVAQGIGAGHRLAEVLQGQMAPAKPAPTSTGKGHGAQICKWNMYIYIYIWIIYLSICMYIISISVFMFTYMYIYTDTNTHTYIYIYMCIYIILYNITYVCVCVIFTMCTYINYKIYVIGSYCSIRYVYSMLCRSNCKYICNMYYAFLLASSYLFKWRSIVGGDLWIPLDSPFI